MRIFVCMYGLVHAAGMKIFGATLLPFARSTRCGRDCGTPAGEAQRQTWILCSSCRVYQGQVTAYKRSSRPNTSAVW
jgi:hypothetical protein